MIVYVLYIIMAVVVQDGAIPMWLNAHQNSPFYLDYYAQQNLSVSGLIFDDFLSPIVYSSTTSVRPQLSLQQLPLCNPTLV